jgi:acyl carrier protein
LAANPVTEGFQGGLERHFAKEFAGRARNRPGNFALRGSSTNPASDHKEEGIGVVHSSPTENRQSRRLSRFDATSSELFGITSLTGKSGCGKNTLPYVRIKCMNTNRDEIRDRVIQSIHELLGPDDVADIDEQTDPIKHLGRDSDDGVDFACLLSEKFDFEFPDDANPLVDDARRRSRSVGEIVDLMCNLLSKQREGSHA